MAFRNGRKGKEQQVEKMEQDKIINVDATMQGSLTFCDPVNLCINGKFEGNLVTKGKLIIGEDAQVKADIVGENVVISGNVIGDVASSVSLSLTRTAYLAGDVRTPRLSIADGAFLQGKCQMEVKEAEVSRTTMQQTFMTVEELAKYLEIDTDAILDWVQKGRVLAQKEGNSWKFDRAKVDAWIASEKIK